MRFYGSLTKVDEEQRMVWGYASTEAVDAHGEIILKDAIEAALDDYMQFANIREMHQLSAVGTAEEAQVDDKGLYLAAKVVDDVAWGKVTSGVYKGFSIGGKVLARDPDDKKTITKILLTEISLVDRPSNPEARFDVYKVAGSPQEDDMAAKKKPAAVKLPKDAKSDVLAKAVNDAVAAGAAIVVATAAEGELLKAINDKVETVVQTELLLEKADTATVMEATEKGADAPGADAGKGEGEVAKADGAKAVADDKAKEGETVEKAADAKADEKSPTAEVKPDPVAKAVAALAKGDAVLVVDGPLEKSMYHVGRFAEYLEGISYLVASAQAEADYEGDKSPVPEKMRDWLKAGAAVFKELAKEEVDEFVESFKVKKAAAATDLAKADGKTTITVDVAAIGGEVLAKALAENADTINNIITERDTLLKTVAAKDESLAKLSDHVEKTVGGLVGRIDDQAKEITEIKKAIDGALAKGIAEGLEKYASSPAPAKTAGSFAVSKEQDAGGAEALNKGAGAMDPEVIQKALSDMDPDERAMLLTKAALQLPRPVVTR